MRLEKIKQISCLLLEVRKLVDICCEERLHADSIDEQFEWWIAIQNFTQFFFNLSEDLDAVAQSLLSPANDAKISQLMDRSVEDAKSEYAKLTMKYYQQPGVWKTKFDTRGWSWVFPNEKRSGGSPLNPVEDDESPDSSDSEQHPEVPRPFYKKPSSRGPKFSSLVNKAPNEQPLALQSSTRIVAGPPKPSGESVEGALGSSRFILAPPAAPPLKPPQLSSSYGSGFTMPTADRVETGCAALATLDQPFPTPTNNAAGRGSLPSHYNYRSEPAPLHNHVEMPASYGLYGSHAYSSQPCSYVNMPTSSDSCARAQPASTSGNWVSSLSPTAVQAYNESSHYDNEEQLLCPDWSRFPVGGDLPLPNDGANSKGVEDFNSATQPYSEPLIFNGPVHTQPVLNRAQFDHAKPPGPQTSQDSLQHYNWAQSQPALNTAQFDRPPPRPAVSSRIIQPYLDQPSIYDQVPRQPASDSAQFEPARRVPATGNNPIGVETLSGSRSYLEQTAGDTAYTLQPSRTAAAAPANNTTAAPANYNVNLIPSSYNDTHKNPSAAYVFPRRSSLLLGGLANQDVVSFQRPRHQGALKK